MTVERDPEARPIGSRSLAVVDGDGTRSEDLAGVADSGDAAAYLAMAAVIELRTV